MAEKPTLEQIKQLSRAYLDAIDTDAQDEAERKFADAWDKASAKVRAGASWALPAPAIAYLARYTCDTWRSASQKKAQG